MDSAGFVVDHFAPAARSLRIAVVSETYPPEVNGVSLSAARFVDGLRARGHQLQLVRPRQDRADAADRDAGFHEVLMRGLPIPRYPHLKMGLPARQALQALWARQRPDVVHIVTEGPLGWSALQAALRLRIPVASDFRTNFHAYVRHYGVGWLRKPIVAYLRKFHNRTRCTMVPTEALRGELAALGFRHLQVLARGVDTRLFDPARRCEALRRRWGAAPGDLVVLSVGRLAAEKNLLTLLAAFEALRPVQPRARLVLVGDGPLKRELQARCPDAVFAGQRSGDDLAAHYASADLFVFPSLTETFGNVTPEAMASALPVLAFDYAAAGQLIDDGVTGALVHCGDEAAFIRRAAVLAAEPDALRRLGARARQRTAELDWERIVARLETILVQTMRDDAAERLPQNGALGVGAG